MPTSATTTFSANRVDPCMDAEDAIIVPVALAASTVFPAGTVLGEAVGTNELQQVAFTGTVSGGTFTLTYSGQTTAAIAWNATAEEVQAALEALSNIGQGDVKVTGSAAPDYYNVEFRGTLAGTNVAQMTGSAASLTGSTPGISISTTRGGAAGASGTFKAYSGAATDGSQVARAILQYDCATDSGGNITLGGASGGGQYGESRLVAPAYFAGTFRTADLTGLDAQAVAALGRLMSGTLSAGVLRIG